MKFVETPLAGAYLIEEDPKHDERGFFARTWCRQSALQVGILFDPVQTSRSFNLRAGTIRGLHCQRPPYSEAKLVTCVRGSIFDVVVDIRPSSSTYAQVFTVTLGTGLLRSIYIPAGFAHGFQTLEDDVEVAYTISEYYYPDASTGVRWDDPRLKISWPLPPSIISPRDRELPNL